MLFSQLKRAYLADMAKASEASVLSDSELVKTIVLEDAPWSRRVSGVFGNDLANQAPDKAHIIVTLNPVKQNDEKSAKKSYTVSLRAPLNNKQGAGDICAKYPTGGGRAAAAGINLLPNEMLREFIDCVTAYYQ